MKSKISIQELKNLTLDKNKVVFVNSIKKGSVVKFLFENNLNSNRRVTLKGVCVKLKRAGIDTVVSIQMDGGTIVSIPVHSPLVKEYGALVL